jgi:hypothetical protein
MGQPAPRRAGSPKISRAFSYPCRVIDRLSIRSEHEIGRKYAEGVKGLKPRVERSGERSGTLGTKHECRPLRRSGGEFGIWKTEIVLRRSKVFIVTGIQIAVSSVGPAYMANTYTQIYIHIVFAVQGRQNLIRREHIR